MNTAQRKMETAKKKTIILMNEPDLHLHGHIIRNSSLSTGSCFHVAKAPAARRWRLCGYWENSDRNILYLGHEIGTSVCYSGIILAFRITRTERDVLESKFGFVTYPADDVCLLSNEEIYEILRHKNARDLLIGCSIDVATKNIVLYRGDTTKLAISFDWFTRTGCDIKTVNVSTVKVDDCGQTLVLGDYEVAVDAILYDHDPISRAKMKAREIEHDSSIGGSIRRLRLQRGLARADFGLAEKTMARIERGDHRPSSASLAKIAQKFGIPVESLATY